MKKKHQKKMKKALEMAKKRADKGNAVEGSESEQSDSLTPSPKRIQLKGQKGPNVYDKLDKWRKSRLEEIKELHRPMDYNELKRHQENIEEMIKKRKEETKQKIYESYKIKDYYLQKFKNSFDL